MILFILFSQNIFICSWLDILLFFACYRINKLDNSHSLSQKSLEIPQEQGESVVTKCIKINSDPDKKAAVEAAEAEEAAAEAATEEATEAPAEAPATEEAPAEA